MAQNKPLNPLLPELPTTIADASERLASYKEGLDKVNAITLQTLGNLKLDIGRHNSDNDTPAEVPPHITEAVDKVRLLLKNQHNIELITEKAMPELLIEAEQYIIELAEARGDLPQSAFSNISLTFKYLAEIFTKMLQAHRRTKALEGLVVVKNGLYSLKDNEAIKASPWVSGFMDTLISEISRTTEPIQVIASVAKTEAAQKAANIRHAPSLEIQIRILKVWDQQKAENPKISKTKVAQDLAPSAVRWNIELGANLATLRTPETAQGAVRKWLQKGNLERIRGLMHA